MSITLPADATAALRALDEFFESRQLLLRDEFLRILRNCQADAKLPGQLQRPLQGFRRRNVETGIKSVTPSPHRIPCVGYDGKIWLSI
jgi:hypothetical protein